MFERRRPATSSEIDGLILTAPGWPDFIREAEVGLIPTLAALGSLPTVLTKSSDEEGPDRQRTVAENATFFARGDLSERDQSYNYFVGVAARDPDFQPELLIARVEEGGRWLLVEGVHRAAALYAVRKRERREDLRLRVFVLPRPIP